MVTDLNFNSWKDIRKPTKLDTLGFPFVLAKAHNSRLTVLTLPASSLNHP